MVADLGTIIANEEALQPENLTRLVVRLTQGQNVMTQVLPMRGSAPAFIWHTEKDTTEYNLPSVTGEKAEAEDNAIEYEKHTGSTDKYFQKMEFSEEELRNGNTYAFINPVQRAALAISRKLRLAIEDKGVKEMTNTTKYTTIQTYDADSVWSTPTGSSPIDDIQNAKYLVQNAKQVEPDIIVLGSEDYKNLTLSAQIRNSNQYTREVINNIEVEKICGLRIVKSDVLYNANGTLSPLLSGQAIVTSSGLAGSFYVSRNISADRDWDKSTQTLTIFGLVDFAAVITDPKMICLIKKLKA